jgi:hypothetical protein
MEYQARYITEDIKLSSYEDKFFKSDIMFDQHMLVWFFQEKPKLYGQMLRMFLEKVIFSHSQKSASHYYQLSKKW